MTRLRALLLSSLLVPAGAAAAQDLSTIPLPDIAPDQIALDSGTDWVNGLEVLRAPSFDPFETVPDIAGEASLRATARQFSRDGRRLGEGIVLDVSATYTSPTSDPYDVYGFERAVFLSGEEAPLISYRPDTLECSTRVREVRYRDDYFSGVSHGLVAGLFTAYPRYRGHRDYGFSLRGRSPFFSTGYRYDPYYFDPYGYSRGLGYGYAQGYRDGRLDGYRGPRGGYAGGYRDGRRDGRRDGTRDWREDRRDGDRYLGGDESREVLGYTVRGEPPRTETRRGTPEDVRAFRRNTETRRGLGVGRLTTDRFRNERRSGDPVASGGNPGVRTVDPVTGAPRTTTPRTTTPRTTTRVTPGRSPTSRARAPRLRNEPAASTPRRTTTTKDARPGRRIAPRTGKGGTTRTPAAPAPRRIDRATDRAFSQPKRAEPKRAEPRRSEPRRSEPRRSEPKRSEPKRSAPPPKRAEPRRAPPRTAPGKAPRRLDYYPQQVPVGDVRCAKREQLSVFIPEERLDTARLTGITVLLLGRDGTELPVFVPPNYVEGYRLAARSGRFPGSR